jgi:quinol monooxygenase YgiN
MAFPSTKGKEMEEFVLIGKMKAKPNCETQLEKALKELSVGTYTEAGCLLYALHRDIENPTTFILIEKWTSKEALEIHFNSPHFLQQFPIIASLVIGEPELTYLTPLSEGKKERFSAIARWINRTIVV